jgi:hypothetical protein
MKQTKTNNMYTSCNKDTNNSMDNSGNSAGAKATTGTPETAGWQTASDTPAQQVRQQ